MKAFKFIGINFLLLLAFSAFIIAPGQGVNEVLSIAEGSNARFALNIIFGFCGAVAFLAALEKSKYYDEEY